MLDPAPAPAATSGVPRRSLLRLGLLAPVAAGAGVALGTAGCVARSRGSGATGTTTSTAAPGEEDLLAAAVLATARVQQDLRTARERHPSLRPRLAAAERLHAAHRAVLDGADATADRGAGTAPAAPSLPPLPPLPPTRSPAAALALLARRETALAQRLGALAVDASSGTFARLLASCGAAARATAVTLGAPPPPAALPDAVVGGTPLPGAAVAVPSLQGALAAEHAAVWALGVLGARTSSSAQPTLAAALTSAYAAHRDRRDLLQELLLALGEEPVASAPAYTLPPSGGPREVAASARAVEGACSTWWAATVAASTADARGLAAAALADAAVRELVGRGGPEIFPGAGELADR